MARFTALQHHAETEIPEWLLVKERVDMLGFLIALAVGDKLKPVFCRGSAPF